MVSPEPRLPLMLSRPRRPVGLRIALAALALLLIVMGLVRVLPASLKQEVDRWRGYPTWLKRTAQRPEPPPFGGLAASQVGYGPSMVKQFSSPKRFTSFELFSDTGELA